MSDCWTTSCWWAVPLTAQQIILHHDQQCGQGGLRTCMIKWLAAAVVTFAPCFCTLFWIRGGGKISGVGPSCICAVTEVSWIGSVYPYMYALPCHRSCKAAVKSTRLAYRLWMWTDRNAGTVTFKLREPGFLRRYEGTWTIKPACGTPMSACYAPADAVAAASVTTSPSSSRYTSPCSSASSSPRATAVPAGTGSSSPASWWGSYRTGSSGGSTHGLDLASASPGGMVVSPLASVSIMDAGAGLKGAVAAIARMQAAFTQSVTNSASNFGTLANSISSSGLPAFTQLPQLLPCPISPATGPVSRAQEQDEPPRQRYWDPSLIPTSSIISAETLTSPKVTPPYPLNALLKNQSKGQVDDMLQGLVRAAVAHLQTQPLQGV